MESREMTSNKRMESDSLRRRFGRLRSPLMRGVGRGVSMKGHKQGCLSCDRMSFLCTIAL